MNDQQARYKASGTQKDWLFVRGGGGLEAIRKIREAQAKAESGKHTKQDEKKGTG
jgi:hypothetical protein